MNTLILNPGSRWLKMVTYSPEGYILSSDKFDIDDANAQKAWFSKQNNITKIGLRVVHGGGMQSPQILDTDTRNTIEKFSKFAPLHNEKAMLVADLAIKYYTNVPVWCVFDTNFHNSLPIEAYTYPIPVEMAKKYSIRRYGFHGVALESVFAQLIELTKEKNIPMPAKVIMVHLGGGSSVTAVMNGNSIATSMGATPLEGVMMITRSGSVDPDIQNILNQDEKNNSEKVSEILNNESGFKGLTGSTDTRQIIENAMLGKEPEKLAFSIYVRSIVEKIFGYYGIMQGVDALVLSGGIGYQNEHIVPEILKYTKIINIDTKNTYSFKADEAKVIFNKI